MKIKLVTFLAFVALVSGCWLGDSSVATIVSLTFPESKGQGHAKRSLEDPEVQNALKLVDKFLMNQGLSRVPLQQIPTPNGTVAQYLSPKTKGCSVSFLDEGLQIVFLETMQRSPSKPVKEISNALAQELTRQFGEAQVQVQTRR